MRTRQILGAAILGALGILWAQQPAPGPDEKALTDRMRKLRSLPDDEWAKSVASLASDIHAMPAGPAKTRAISGLQNLATEGDAGHATLQLIADTIVDVIHSLPADQRGPLCGSLAPLVRYEHLSVPLEDPAYRAAMEKLAAEDQTRMNADFSLTDIHGQAWRLRDLRGKVVLVNFWATWCPPCRKEMPDMQALFERFSAQGLVILAISDETHDKVDPFIAEKKYAYPILLDPGRTVNTLFAVEGIPKSFLYDRSGKLVAEAIDRRTKRQFLEMLKMAGVE